MSQISETSLPWSIAVDEFVSVDARAGELGIHSPRGLAILPDNFDVAESPDEFLLQGQASTFRKLLTERGVEFEYVSSDGVGYINNKSVDWIAPTIFVSASLISQDQNAVSVALNVISTYLTDFFKQIRPPVVKLQFVVEKRGDRTCKKLTYEGDVSGLASLEAAIKRLADE